MSKIQHYSLCSSKTQPWTDSNLTDEELGQVLLKFGVIKELVYFRGLYYWTHSFIAFDSATDCARAWRTRNGRI